MSSHKEKTKEIVADNTNKNLQQVLIKKATGFKVKETVQEFSIVEDELRLTKKRVSVKYYPPDLSAVELLLKTQKDLFNFENYTDEELEVEKQKLIKQLKLFNSAEKEVKESKKMPNQNKQAKTQKQLIKKTNVKG